MFRFDGKEYYISELCSEDQSQYNVVGDFSFYLFERDLMKKSEIDLCIFPDEEIFCAFPEKYFVKMRGCVSRGRGVTWRLKGLTVQRHLLPSKRTTLLLTFRCQDRKFVGTFSSFFSCLSYSLSNNICNC